jgi:integrase
MKIDSPRVTRITRPSSLNALISDYTRRYANPRTAYRVAWYLHDMFDHARKHSPAEISENDVIAWVVHPPAANNHVRQRLSVARTFLRWCARQGTPVPDIEESAAQVRREHPKCYAKAQAPYPARFLTRDQADQLIAACRDTTWTGSRDQLIVRLGLYGLRISEIADLTWRNLQVDHLTWLGKGRKPRRVTLKRDMVRLLDLWRNEYARHTEVTGDTPLLCNNTNQRPPRLIWGAPMQTLSIRMHVTRRADAAGLGHVAPHDLRRTAASMLHNARDDNGGHLFDLLDIQQVLGHSDPATTMRSYLEPISTEVLDKAAAYIG